jgi:hypothetical protein
VSVGRCVKRGKKKGDSFESPFVLSEGGDYSASGFSAALSEPLGWL